MWCRDDMHAVIPHNMFWNALNQKKCVCVCVGVCLSEYTCMYASGCCKYVLKLHTIQWIFFFQQHPPLNSEKPDVVLIQCQFSCMRGYTLPLGQTTHGKPRCSPYALNQSISCQGESSLHEQEAEVKPLKSTAPVEKSTASESRRRAVPFRKPKPSPEL